MTNSTGESILGPATLGRRERKKLETRQLLVETALRLFEEKGYDGTTVAEIADAADVATKTFFNHFGSKDDVLFVGTRQRLELAMTVIAERSPGESLASLLDRLAERTIELITSKAAEFPTDLLHVRSRLIMSVPDLQARALHLMFESQRRLAEALHKAYPHELDPITASAAVGALVGAAQAALLAGLELGQSRRRQLESVRLAVDVAMRGIRSL